MSSEKEAKKEPIAAHDGSGASSARVYSNADEKKPVAAEGSSTHVTIKVKDQNEHEVHFRIRRDTKIKKLMDAYCARKKQGVDSLVFMFDAMRLKGEQTPDELEMVDNDSIDVFGHQIGGSVIIAKIAVNNI